MKPTVINLHEAKTHLSRLVDEVAAGAELIIGKAGAPLAKLVPYHAPAATPRRGGQLHGKIWESDDCWEADAELTAMMTESPLLPATGASLRMAKAPAKRGAK